MQVFYRKISSQLIGLKFFGKQDEVLLEYVKLTNDQGVIQQDVAKGELTLEEDERLIGIRSSGKRYKLALHYSV